MISEKEIEKQLWRKTKIRAQSGISNLKSFLNYMEETGREICSPNLRKNILKIIDDIREEIKNQEKII